MKKLKNVITPLIVLVLVVMIGLELTEGVEQDLEDYKAEHGQYPECCAPALPMKALLPSVGAIIIILIVLALPRPIGVPP